MSEYNIFKAIADKLPKDKFKIEPEEKKDEKVAKQLSALLNHYLNDKSKGK